MFRKCLVTAVAAFGIAGAASAGSVYSFDLNRQGKHMVDEHGEKVAAGINDKAGKVLNVSGSYDTGSHELTWSTTIGKKGWSSFDGFWLVINDGGNPKQLAQEGKLGIMYFDAWSRDVTIYQYTHRGGSSYKNGQLLASTKLDDSFVKSVDIDMHHDSKTASLTLDLAAVNSAMGGDWMGMQFGSQVGIWMHVFDFGQIKYRHDGSIKSWCFKKHGWLDTNGIDTKVVPTPTAAMAGLAGLGLLGSRRKNRAA